jgi:hypothetical protein
MPQPLNLSYCNNIIVVQTQGKYKGYDGEMYPYASTYVEGTGVKDVWDYIQYLEQKLKEVNK